MYYEEKIIGEELRFKTRPDAEWQPFSAKTLTAMIVSMRKELERAEKKIKRLERIFHEPI